MSPAAFVRLDRESNSGAPERLVEAHDHLRPDTEVEQGAAPPRAGHPREPKLAEAIHGLGDFDPEATHEDPMAEISAGLAHTAALKRDRAVLTATHCHR